MDPFLLILNRNPWDRVKSETLKDTQIVDGWAWNLNLSSFSSEGIMYFNTDVSGLMRRPKTKSLEESSSLANLPISDP